MKLYKGIIHLTTLRLNLKNSLSYIKTLVKWLIIACVVGIVGGVIGSIFHETIDAVTHFREDNRWVMYLLPIGGLLIVWLYSIMPSKGKIDTNRVIDAVKKDDEKVPLIMTPLIFISTVITHFLGGSAGREGAALQLGGSIGYNLGKVCRLNKNDMHTVVMTGMSAVFAALFGTPLTAAIFSLEVISVGAMHYAAIVPCVISAVVASQIALAFGLHPVHFDLALIPNISIGAVSQVVVLAVLCALVSILFCVAIHKCEHLMEKWFKGKYIRAFIGGVIIIALTLLFRTYDYNGAGMDVITRAINGDARYEAFLLKIIFTAITISAGFKGGEIVPAFFIGSTFGCVAGSILGLDAGFAAALGFVALFCGVVNCPIASIILSVEAFGAEGVLFFAIMCAVTYMMSGYFGLYKSQEFQYSKLSDEQIDIDTN